MTTLDSEEIKFIDTYLENSDVRFADIRMEMVDHVASEIEAIKQRGDTRDFYYIFKDYMVANKARLLNDNRKFLKSTDKKLVNLIFKTMLSFKGLAFFALSFITLYVLTINMNLQEHQKFLSFLPIGILLLLGVFYFGYLKILKLDRFSAIERMGLVYAVAYQLLNLISIVTRKDIFSNSDKIYLLFFTSLGLLFTFCVIVVTFNLVRHYQQQFKNV